LRYQGGTPAGDAVLWPRAGIEPLVEGEISEKLA
jgi:hypothetical protein